MNHKKTLIEKYNIPLCHLDFKYIEECKDAREMEKILQILRSGEEGFYPDLTRCAEEKLRLLKPHSRHFRVEEPVLGRNALSANEWNPFYEWTHTIKSKDNKLEAVCKLPTDDSMQDLPPIRKAGTIKANKQDANENDDQSTTKSSNKNPERIKSTDYTKWDKYDPDVEVLKMELAEERVTEAVERKNRLNLQKSAPTPRIEDIEEDVLKADDRWNKLSDVEREKFAIDFRLRGNEYFRAKEYEHAIIAYTKAINMWPVSAVDSYNNRALTFIKLEKYEKAVADCQNCLKLEPNNVKAWLRQAEAINMSGKKSESYPLYQKVLELDPGNKAALKAIKELQHIYGERPPADATRIQIEETQSTINSKEKSGISSAANSKNKNIKNKAPEYDFAELVKPNVIVENSLDSIADYYKDQKTEANEPLLFEPSTTKNTKLLIEELN